MPSFRSMGMPSAWIATTPESKPVTIENPVKQPFPALLGVRPGFVDSINRLARANRELDRETFILFNCNPGDVDWFDDRGWRETIDHFRIVARAAKQSGSVGIIFDPEPYPHDKPVVPFSYERQPQRGRHTFVEYQAKARQRGRESMLAMSDEFPDMTILSFFLTSYVTQDQTYRGPNVVEGDSLQQSLATHQYNLLIPFLIGWLDEAPASMRIIDGNEEAYYYTRQSEYLAAAHRINQLALQLLPPELIEKYQEVVEVGSAVYLDNCQPTHPLYAEHPASLTQSDTGTSTGLGIGIGRRIRLGLRRRRSVLTPELRPASEQSASQQFQTLGCTVSR